MVMMLQEDDDFLNLEPWGNLDEFRYNWIMLFVPDLGEIL